MSDPDNHFEDEVREFVFVSNIILMKFVVFFSNQFIIRYNFYYDIVPERNKNFGFENRVFNQKISYLNHPESISIITFMFCLVFEKV